MFASTRGISTVWKRIGFGSAWTVNSDQQYSMGGFMGTRKTEPKTLPITTPAEPLQQRAEKWTNKQLAAYLRKQKNNTKNGELKELCRAIVFSIVLENTAMTGLGGKLASALRG
jgi:hypothetical protein